MSEQDRRLINRVLIEYYEGGYTQREISEMEHISRSSICRILQRARAEKLVRFEFNLFADKSADQLAQELRERLALESVRVVPCYLDDPTSRLRGRCLRAGGGAEPPAAGGATRWGWARARRCARSPLPRPAGKPHRRPVLCDACRLCRAGGRPAG